jgi:hypothetical protein
MLHGTESALISITRQRIEAICVDLKIDKPPTKQKDIEKILCCDAKTFKVHIESTFKKGMTWANYGQGDAKWEIDHKYAIPTKDILGNPIYCFDEVVDHFNYTNTRAMWSADNRSHRYNGRDYDIDDDDEAEEPPLKKRKITDFYPTL